MRAMLLLLLMLSWWCPALASAQVQASTGDADHAAELDAYIAKSMADWKLPGMSIAVVKDGRPVYVKGFGVRTLEQPAPVDADTRFGMMSTTKAMTALAVAMLVDEGKLGWDDPVRKTLPWFEMADAGFSRQLTVRDTLRHNAGLGADADLLWVRGDLSSRQILERVRTLTSGYTPYSDFKYANVMYQVAGELVSTASGMPWERFIETRIMAPIGMTRSNATYASMAAQRDDNLSAAYFEIDGKLRRVDDGLVDGVPAAGAAWSTANDAARWMQFLLAEGQVNGKRLVSEDNFRELFKPQVLVPPGEFYPTMQLTRPHWTSYGLGWFQQDYRGQFVAMHTGSLDGRIAIVGLMPEQELGVFVFGNADHVELRHALMWKVFDLYTGAPARDWSAELLTLYGGMKTKGKQAQAENDAKRVKATQPSHALAAYAGTYTHPSFGDIEVSLRNGALALRFGPLPENNGPLKHWHYDSFRWPGGDGRYGETNVRFEQSDEGGIDALIMALGAPVRFVRKATP